MALAVLAMLAMLVLGTVIAGMEVGLANLWLFGLYKAIGITLLALVLVRLFWHRISPPPAPIFWLGLLGLLVFYAKLGWISGPGRIDIAYEYDFTQPTGLLLIDTAMQGAWRAFGNVFSHIILPASLLGFYSLA